MDTIKFKTRYYTYGPDDYSSVVADIFINGKNFLETVKNFEAELGQRGDYAPVRDYYLYAALSRDYKEDFVFIYDCGCGCDGCHPFCVYVDVGEKVVTWYDFMTSEEYFDDVCLDNNFEMFRERIRTKGGLPPLVFDKEQYFAELEKLKAGTCDTPLTFEYGGIECGYISLFVSADGKRFEFIFDELLNDPFPQLVKLFNAAKNNDNCEIILADGDAKRSPLLRISVKQWFNGQLRFYIELVREGITFKEYYRREEVLEMLEKVFSGLLNDKYFPYSYPCFWYCGDSENYEAVTDKIEDENPTWEVGDVLNEAFRNGGLTLLPRHKDYLEKYKKMLTEYTVPEGWE